MRNFSANLENSTTAKKLAKISQNLNRHQTLFKQEKLKIKKSNLTTRKLRTRFLIQIGGLVLKSGLLERLDIQTGEDLQDHENLPKASQLMGFLLVHSENKEFTEDQLTQWQRRGERAIRYE